MADGLPNQHLQAMLPIAVPIYVCYRVDASEKVLIGDFGLARDIYAKDYYQLADKKRPLPIKWMAPECIDKGIFSNKSDVVSRILSFFIRVNFFV